MTLASTPAARAIALAAACLLFSGTARAGRGPFIEHGTTLLDGTATEVGLITQGGLGEYAATTAGGIAPNAQGMVLRDRNGVTAQMVFGLLIAVSSAMAQAGPKSVETTRTETSTHIITTTRTTYYSEAEKAEMRENANQAIDGLFNMRNSEFELQVFSRDRWGYGDSSGHKATFLVGEGGSGMVFETGFAWGDVNSIVHKDGRTYALDHKYFGMPFRASFALRPVRVALTWEWNWMAHGLDVEKRTPKLGEDGMLHAQVGHHPVHLDVEAALFGRVFVTAGATQPNFKRFDFGYRSSVGFRF